MQPLPALLDSVLGALEECAPAAAPRARAAIRALLQPVMQSAWPEVAWCAGSLTGDGFPVEFSCNSESDEEIRYAVECAAPEWPNHARLDRALELLSGVGAAAVEPVVVSQFREMQAGRALRYGAFLSGRHDASSDRFKLYVEVPDGCVPQWVPAVGGIEAAPVMIGCEPGSRRCEYYFRVSGPLTTGQLSELASRTGVGHRVDDLLSLVGEVWGRPVRRCLPGQTIGFSVSRSGERCGALGVFEYVSSLFTTDGGVRRRLLEVAKARNWRCEQYERLTRAFERYQPPTMAHTMFTFAIGESGPVSLRVGLRPAG
jgi:hypothetical protein